MKEKRLWLNGLSFAVPFMIMVIIWVSLNIAPFGDHNLLVSDIGTQYLQFMSLFKKFFEEGFTFYSFSNGLGGSIEALSGYYLLSPFNLICLFFKQENLPIALIWIITAKIAAIGGAMYYYLSQHYRQKNYLALIFSTAYSLCGFVVAYSLNFMWLDALIFFPLVVLGLEKFWRKESSALYAVTLFATIVTNYYLGYMVCLFAVVYSIYLYWLAYPKKVDWNLSTLFNRWKKFILVSFLTGLAASFILIPSLLGMMKTAKTDFSILSFTPRPKFIFSALAELGIGTYDFDMRLDHLPSMYSGIFIFLLFITYFCAGTIAKRERQGAFFLTLVLFLSFMIELFNTVWHMFQSPAGFPYRNAFIYSFLIIRFAYDSLLRITAEKDQKKYSTVFGKAGLIFSGILLLGWLGVYLENQFFQQVSNSRLITSSSVYVPQTLFLTWFYVLLLIFFIKSHKEQVLILIAGLTFFELGFNYRHALKDIPFGSQKEFASFYQRQNHLISELTEGADIFRINEKTDKKNDGFSVSYNSYNDSFLYNFADISSYTSTLEKEVLDTLVELGIYSRNVRRFTYVDENPVLNLLLNVKYSIKPNELRNRTPYLTENKLDVYENPEAIGMGFLINRSDLVLKKNRVIENQEKILQSIRANVSNYYREASVVNQAVLDDGNRVTLQLRANTTGNLFMYLPKVQWKNVESMTVNGERHNTDIAIETNQLFNLGHFEKNESVTIELKSAKNLNFAEAEIASLDEKMFDKFLNAKSKFAVELEGHDDDNLFGTVTAESEGKRLFLSIPYDTAWTVRIDGKKVETEKVYGSFLSVKVPAGTHRITLSYQSSASKVGFAISVTIVISGALYRYIYKPKKQAKNRRFKKKEKSEC